MAAAGCPMQRRCSPRLLRQLPPQRRNAPPPSFPRRCRSQRPHQERPGGHPCSHGSGRAAAGGVQRREWRRAGARALGHSGTPVAAALHLGAGEHGAGAACGRVGWRRVGGRVAGRLGACVAAVGVRRSQVLHTVGVCSCGWLPVAGRCVQLSGWCVGGAAAVVLLTSPSALPSPLVRACLQGQISMLGGWLDRILGAEDWTRVSKQRAHGSRWVPVCGVGRGRCGRSQTNSQSFCSKCRGWVQCAGRARGRWGAHPPACRPSPPPFPLVTGLWLRWSKS